MAFNRAMEHLKILNSKEKKEIIGMINAQWDADFSTGMGMLRNNEDKIFLINPAVSAIELSRLRINSMGLYVAEVKKGKIRLSIEGSQLVGPAAKKSVIEFSRDEMQKWLMGEDIPWECAEKGFLLVRHGRDFLGTGVCANGSILNYVGKNRRVSATHD